MSLRCLSTPFLILLFVGICCCSSSSPFHFTLLHTNDLHSRVIGGGPDNLFSHPNLLDEQDEVDVKGHYARLAYKIKQIQKKKEREKEPVLLLDGGDFFSGSLFHSLTISPPSLSPYTPELEFFSYCNYSAVSLGNHEFDAGEEGLLTMITKAENSGFTIPLVATNYYLKEHSTSKIFDHFVRGEEMVKREKREKREKEKGVTISDFLVKELSFRGEILKVGIIGVVGPDAAMGSLSGRQNTSFYGFDDEYKRKKIREVVSHAVETMKKMEEFEVNVVILTTHMGDPEDEEFVYNLQPFFSENLNLDIVIAGHTHNIYFTESRGTIISQTGAFGENLGILELSYDFAKKKVSVRYPERTHIPMDSTVPLDNHFLSRVTTFQKNIKDVTPYLEFQWDDVVYDKAVSDPTNIFGYEETEMSLATVACTGILSGLEQHAHDFPNLENDPVLLYFIPPGMIRSNVEIRNDRLTLQFSDVFRLLAMGFDEDLHVGFNVVDFYLTKSELSLLIESISTLQATISPLIGFAWSQSLEISSNSMGIPFYNRYYLKIGEREFSELPELIHVATNSFLAGWLQRSEEMTFGFLSLLPKDKDGVPLRGNKLKERNLPLKEFDLLSDYLQTL